MKKINKMGEREGSEKNERERKRVREMRGRERGRERKRKKEKKREEQHSNSQPYQLMICGTYLDFVFVTHQPTENLVSS